jgi:Uma2 family endonuclease
MSLAKKLDNKISEEDYLAGELISDVKYEYIDGEVFAMAGASTKHNLITKNTLYQLENQLRNKNSACDVFSSDMKVKITDTSKSFFYPDAMVICDKNNSDDYFQDSPTIIVEVLSKSTRRNDLSTKKLFYFNIPSLQEYMVIEQNLCEVEVFRKSDNWTSTVYFLGDNITFASLDITLSVEDIYYHIENEDITKYLIQKAAELEEENTEK